MKQTGNMSANVANLFIRDQLSREAMLSLFIAVPSQQAIVIRLFWLATCGKPNGQDV
jgi:hypothetical protein